jgi:hypothetical protein
MPLPIEQQVGIDGQTYNVLVTENSVPSVFPSGNSGPIQIPYLELLTYRERGSRMGDDTESTRTCLCMWEQRLPFLLAMLGTSTRVPPQGQNGAPFITRLLPEEHPELVGLFATQYELSGQLGVPTQDRGNLIRALQSTPAFSGPAGTPPLTQTNPLSNMVSFSLAQYEITYRPFDYVFDTDQNMSKNPTGELSRFVSRYVDPSAEALVIPGNAAKWVSDGTLIPEPPAIPQPILEYQYVWHDVPGGQFGQFLPAFEPLVGTCNQLAFDPQGFNCAPQTLLCQAPKLKWHFTASGDIVWDITYIFTFKSWTHNAIYRRAIGGNGPPGYDPVSLTNGQPVIPTMDFAELFLIS